MVGTRADWFSEVREASPHVVEVAAALGLGVVRARFGPCPACGRDERRHPPLTVRHGGSGWMCAGCKAAGDAVMLAAWAIAGEPRPSGAAWAPVRAFFASRGWCSGDGMGTGWTPAPRREVPALPYPDRGELLALLRACRPVSAVPEVGAWLEARGIVGRVHGAVLPDVHPWPAWWPYRARPWRLVAPMVDALGTVASVHGRATEDEGGRGKTRCPFERRGDGLFFADPLVGRPMLRGEASPARVVVVEGITDYLSAARYATADGGGTAVLGGISGSFGAMAQARITPGATVYAWTDADDAGDRYAKEIARALRDQDVRRIDFRRTEE